MEFSEEFMRQANIELLGQVLRAIIDAGTDYVLRNKLVIQAMGIADSLGYAAGVRLDAQEPEWPVFFIELPTGQISWHLPQHILAWDGHDDDTKVDRIRRYIAGV